MDKQIANSPSLSSAFSNALSHLLTISLACVVACGLYTTSSAADPAEKTEGNLKVGHSAVPWSGYNWTCQAPRAEIQPRYSQAGDALMLHIDQPGQAGWWQADVAIEGGKTYRVNIDRKTEGIATPHRSTVVRIDWLDAKDKRVPSDRAFVKGVLEGYRDAQQPDYLDEPRKLFEQDSTLGARQTDSTLFGQFTAPRGAVKARVELHLRWCDVGGQVTYKNLVWKEAEATPGRSVKVASIHLQPKGGNPQGNREAFAGLIAQAAEAGVQLVVLPETLTYYGTGKTPVEVSETVPGPTTEYFGKLARQHRLHIVTTCFEKDGTRLFNTAMLMGPDGEMIGKYRKVCIPRGEIEAGVEPSDEYPVFDTAIGRIGMMICYDGFFPQVAQRLTDAGAELIAFPVWGCNPLLARARAAENQVFVVSSTYTAPNSNWMISAVIDPTGKVLSQATEWGTMAIADVELKTPPYWPSLGTHRLERFHHQPAERK